MIKDKGEVRHCGKCTLVHQTHHICLCGRVIFWGIKGDFKQLKVLHFSTIRHLNFSNVRHIFSRYVGTFRKCSYALDVFEFIVSFSLNTHFHFQDFILSLLKADKLFN